MITIFTDGSSRGNPGPGGWGAIVADGVTVTEIGGGEAHTTNNRMELTAAVMALGCVGGLSGSAVIVNTDSSYLISGITKWVHGWAKKNWMTSQKEEVMNRDLWEKLIAAANTAEKKTGEKISWKHVGGHVGIAGNERCDEIATSFADGRPADLYSGSLADYSIPDIADLSKNTAPVAEKSRTVSAAKSRSRAKAYSYVSKVNGLVQTHRTWQECEGRVRGVAGARYRKSLNTADEARILADFSKGA